MIQIGCRMVKSEAYPKLWERNPKSFATMCTKALSLAVRELGNVNVSERPLSNSLKKAMMMACRISSSTYAVTSSLKSHSARTESIVLIYSTKNSQLTSTMRPAVIGLFWCGHRSRSHGIHHVRDKWALGSKRTQSSNLKQDPRSDLLFFSANCRICMAWLFEFWRWLSRLLDTRSIVRVLKLWVGSQAEC